MLHITRLARLRLTTGALLASCALLSLACGESGTDDDSSLALDGADAGQGDDASQRDADAPSDASSVPDADNGIEIGADSSPGKDDASSDAGGQGQIGACTEVFGLDVKTCKASAVAAGLAGDPKLLLVVDKSGSMADTPAGFSKDKWAALIDAVSVALGEVEDQISIGLAMYPSEGCTVEEGPAAISVLMDEGAVALPAINAALGKAVLRGGTPTAVALDRALDYFTIGTGMDLRGRKSVLLITDGGPNCNAGLACEASSCTNNIQGVGSCTPTGPNCCAPKTGDTTAALRCLDDEATVAAVTALADVGIKTYVVGIPGTDAYSGVLDSLAEAGLTAAAGGAQKHIAVPASGGSSALTDALRNVGSQLTAGGCDVELANPVPDPRIVNLVIDCKLVPQTDSGGVPQWELVTTSEPHVVRLLGDTCAQVTADVTSQVEVILGCMKVP